MKGQVAADNSPRPARVFLALDSEFTSYRHTMYMGDHYVYELGELLRSGAEEVVRALFTEVIVGQPDGPPTNIDLTFSPRVAAVRMTPLGSTRFETRVTTVSIEWTVRDATGKIVWLDTVDGEGSSEVGTITSRSQLTIERFKSASRSVFQTSLIRIRESPEIEQRLQKKPANASR